MTPSRYQKAVYAFVQGAPGYHEEVAWDQPLPEGGPWGIDFRGKRHAVVEAVAGSGKTTTIVKALDHLKVIRPEPVAVGAGAGDVFDGMTRPRQPKVLFVAFNRHIAEELQRRVPSYVTASTLNSVGWGVCRQNVRRVELDRYKDENILKTLLVMDDEDDRKTYYKIRGAVSKFVGLFKSLIVRSRDEIEARFEEIADYYDVGIPETGPEFDFKRKLVEVWQRSVDCQRFMSFDDQKFMPVFHGWSFPSYDWLFGDEAQDWSPCDIELVRRLGRDGRIVAVGDRFQSIYSFRGADPEAIPNIIRELDAAVLPLSVCYRCPDKVIAAAREIVPHIENPEGNPKGDGVVEWRSTEEFESQVADGDYALCRTTAPLVKRCLKMIGRKRKATVKGRDIGQGLLAFLEDLAPSPHTPIQEFIDRLAAHKLDKVERLSKAGRDAEAQAVEDRCDTLEVLAFDCNVTGDIKRRIDQVFSDSDSPGVTFCTIHRSKGLEAKRVWILRPDLLPHPKSTKPVQAQQERNLKYVAITRSQGELYWVQKERDEK